MVHQNSWASHAPYKQKPKRVEQFGLHATISQTNETLSLDCMQQYLKTNETLGPKDKEGEGSSTRIVRRIINQGMEREDLLVKIYERNQGVRSAVGMKLDR